MTVGMSVIGIGCSDPSHEPKVCQVALFGKHPGRQDGWHRWPVAPHIAENATRYLTADDDVIPPENLTEGASARVREGLECKLCGLKASAWIGTLSPMLDKLDENGISTVELRFVVEYLAGMVS